MSRAREEIPIKDLELINNILSEGMSTKKLDALKSLLLINDDDQIEIISCYLNLLQ